MRQIIKHSILAGLVVLTSVAHAAPPTQKQLGIAERLHKQALLASRRGDHKQAISDWEAAEAVHKHWKYAFNLASSLAHTKQWLAAWSACQRSQQYDFPQKHLGAYKVLERKIGDALLPDHALLELEVQPSDAEVTRNGDTWAPPYKVWTRDDSSTIVVTHPDYSASKVAWKHPVGKMYSRTVELAQSATSVTTQAPNAPLPAVQVEDTVNSNTYGLWKWTALGTSVVAFAAGLGMVIHAEGLVGELDELNTAPGDQFEAYSTEYDKRLNRMETSRAWGWALTGIGVACATASTILFVLDAGQHGQEQSSSRLFPVVLPGGMGLSGQVRF